MSKTNQTTKRYFKLGPTAESFFDPISRMKVNRGRMGMVEPPHTQNKLIANAIRGGQIVEVSQEEYLAFQAARPKAPVAATKGATTGITQEAFNEAVAAAKEEGYQTGFEQGLASAPEAELGEAIPENLSKMSLEDLKLFAVKLKDLSLESVTDVTAMTKKAEVVAFIESYFEDENEEA